MTKLHPEFLGNSSTARRRSRVLLTPKLALIAMGLSLLSGVGGCHADSSISGLNTLNPKGAKSKKEDKKNSSLVEDPENEDAFAQEPTPITGAFLSCVRITNSEDSGYQDGDGEGIGCAVRDGSQRKISTSQYQVQAKFLEEGGQSRVLKFRPTPQESALNFFIYFQPKLLFTGAIYVSLTNAGQQLSLSFPMERLQENTRKEKMEELSKTLDPPPPGNGNGTQSSPPPPMEFKSGYSLATPKAQLMSQAFHPSMFCRDGLARPTVVGNFNEVRESQIEEGLPISRGSPDLKKVTCFGKIKNKEDMVLFKTALVVSDRDCLFMRDKNNLYIFDQPMIQSGDPRYTKENLEKFALTVPACDDG
jgi:hypothetical protein